jgi:hypothetical protein
MLQGNRYAFRTLNRVVNARCFSDNTSDNKSKPFSEYVPQEHRRNETPTARTARILKNDFKRVGNWVQDKVDYFRQLNPKQKRYPAPIESIDHFIQNRERTTMFQSHCDVLVIGGK